MIDEDRAPSLDATADQTEDGETVDPEELATARSDETACGCGATHTRCAGHNIFGAPCAAWPVRGSDTCRRHGETPDTRRKRADTVKKAQVTAVARTYGAPVSMSPQAGIVEVIERTAGHVRWLAEQIAELEPRALAWVQSEETVSKGTYRGAAESGAGKKWSAQVHRYVVMYQQERQLLARVCADAVRLDLEERSVRLDEIQAEIVVRVIMAVFDDPAMGLDDGRRQMGREIAARHLALVAG